MAFFTSIRFLIPVVTLGILLVTAGLMFAASYHSTHNKVVAEARHKVETRLNLLQGTAEHFLRMDHDHRELRQFLSSFAAETDLHVLLVADPQGKILAGNRAGALDRRWQDAYPDLHAPSIEDAVSNRTLRIRELSDKQLVEGYASMCNPTQPHALRPAGCGFIAYQLDLGPRYASADRTLQDLAINLLWGLLLVAATILVALHLLITRRAGQMVTTLQAFAAGERDSRIPLSRNDEITRLSSTINQLLDWVVSDEQALKEQQQRLRALFSTVNDAIITIDSRGTIQSVNPATEQLFGYAQGELIGENVKLLMPSDIAEQHDGFLERYLQSGEKRIIGSGREVQARTKQYRLFTAELSVSEMLINGESYFTGLIRDVSERARLLQEMAEANEQLQDREERLRAVFDTVTDAIITMDSRGTIQDINPATEQLFGYEKDELIGQNVALLMPGNIAARHDGYVQRYLDTGEKRTLGKGAMETEAMDKNGRRFAIAASLSEMNIKGERFFTGLIRDISEQVAMREVMEQLNEHLLSANLSLQESATTDGLTGLANRRQFDKTLDIELRRCTREQMPLSLMLIDVDYFKRYNDRYGHQQGDSCLQGIAQSLKDTFQRVTDLAARYGGEEFAVILPNTDQDAALLLAGRLRSNILERRMPHAASDVADHVTVSIGVTTYHSNTAPSVTTKSLIQTADEALYTAKSQGRNQACFQETNAKPAVAGDD